MTLTPPARQPEPKPQAQAKPLGPLTIAVTPEQAAEFLNMFSGTLRDWRKKGIGPRFVRWGGRVRYIVDELRTWALGQAVEPAFARAQAVAHFKPERIAAMRRNPRLRDPKTGRLLPDAKR